MASFAFCLFKSIFFVSFFGGDRISSLVFPSRVICFDVRGERRGDTFVVSVQRLIRRRKKEKRSIRDRLTNGFCVSG